jgi:hypothetical protein
MGVCINKKRRVVYSNVTVAAVRLRCRGVIHCRRTEFAATFLICCFQHQAVPEEVRQCDCRVFKARGRLPYGGRYE